MKEKDEGRGGRERKTTAEYIRKALKEGERRNRREV